MIFTHFFFIPRYLILLAILFYAAIGAYVLSIGADIDNLGETRIKLIMCNTQFSMHVFGFFFGVREFKYNRPKVDYSKWLGPDWKPDYGKASMYVSSHQSWYDVFNTFLFARPMPGFVAKYGVKEIPSVGVIATAVGSLFLDRTKKEERHKVFDQIRER